MLGTTFGGNHLACAASLAVLEVIESEQLIKKVAQTGILFRKELESINEVKEVRGKGLMLGVEFDFPVAEMRKRCFMNSMCLRDHLRTKIRYDYCHR